MEGPNGWRIFESYSLMQIIAFFFRALRGRGWQKLLLFRMIYGSILFFFQSCDSLVWWNSPHISSDSTNHRDSQILVFRTAYSMSLKNTKEMTDIPHVLHTSLVCPVTTHLFCGASPLICYLSLSPHICCVILPVTTHLLHILYDISTLIYCLSHHHMFS